MSLEVELKLQLLTDDPVNLKDNPWVALCCAEPPRTVHLVSTYFDTPDLQLYKQRICLRLRKVGNQWLQTVKTPGTASAGLHQRNEWEDVLNGPEWDLQALRQTPIASLVDDDAMWSRIEPVFVTDFQRSIYWLNTEDDDVVELVHDRGAVRAQWCRETQSYKADEPINELELELKAGEPSVLFLIGSSLCHSIPLHHANRSKAERGYRLLGEYTPATPVKAAKYALTKQMSAEESLQRVLRSCLQQLQLNEQALSESPEEPEAVHQMRVATRKIRACLAIFREVVGKSAIRERNRDIKWITDRLGPARDWDVFILETLRPMASEFGGREDFQRLLVAADDQHQRAYEHAITSTQSTEYARRLLDFSAWLESGNWRLGLSNKRKQRLNEPLLQFASRQIESRYQEALGVGRDMSALTVDQRHELRIDCKRLRYTLEFFQEIFPKKKVKPLIQLLSELQDCLGRLNDMAVATELLNQLNLDENAPERWLVLGWCGATAQVHDSDLADLWNRIHDHEQFWRDDG